MPAASSLRSAMVDAQIAARGVRDPAVLGAMRVVPRERFVPAHLRELAYEDMALPIEAGQTISQPYIVAYMIESAGIARGARVLEIGAGSGYAAAVMSRIADKVYAVERLAELADRARERMAALGYTNVEIRTRDGIDGWPEAAPFDAILVAAAARSIPERLPWQLAIGGHLVMPVGERDQQRLVRVTRRATAAFDEACLGDVRFVPLISAHGQA